MDLRMNSCKRSRVVGAASGSRKWSTGIIMREVCVPPNEDVEEPKINAHQSATTSHDCTRMSRKLLDPIVRRLARDNHVVHVAFSQAGGCNANKSGAFLKFF